MVTHAPKYRITVYDNRVGETAVMKCGMSATITEYYHRHDITVRMSDGTIIYKRTYTAFTQGTIDPARVRRSYMTLPSTP